MLLVGFEGRKREQRFSDRQKRAEARKHTSETLIGSFTTSVRETKTKMISETFLRTSAQITFFTHVENI